MKDSYWRHYKNKRVYTLWFNDIINSSDNQEPVPMVVYEDYLSEELYTRPLSEWSAVIDGVPRFSEVESKECPECSGRGRLHDEHEKPYAICDACKGQGVEWLDKT